MRKYSLGYAIVAFLVLLVFSSVSGTAGVQHRGKLLCRC
jgi:hypothetical protein